MNKPLFLLYKKSPKKVRAAIRGALWRLEGKQFLSPTLRAIFEEYHGVKIGLYTHGSCFHPFACDPGTTIGRYCSFAEGVRIINHNHSLDAISTHAYFFNPRLGYTNNWGIEYSHTDVGHDVWIGINAIIMPSCTTIGNGAVIAAGAIVNKDIPPYAVVAGNPARIARYRLDPDTINRVEESRWWDRTIEELSPVVRDFLDPAKFLETFQP